MFLLSCLQLWLNWHWKRPFSISFFIFSFEETTPVILAGITGSCFWAHSSIIEWLTLLFLFPLDSEKHRQKHYKNSGLQQINSQARPVLCFHSQSILHNIIFEQYRVTARDKRMSSEKAQLSTIPNIHCTFNLKPHILKEIYWKPLLRFCNGEV